MKPFKSFTFLLLFALFSACNASFGERYTVGNLEIYYTPKSVSDNYVVAMAAYFKDNGLLQDKKHSIQLTSDHYGFVLNMVLNDDYKTLPESELNNLALLEADIKSVVFDDLNFRIAVCNANFNPINTVE